ncbi:endothelin-converting enzyme-like 1 [Ornithodoros turicata]|uniref:endothelin-converting enzyme-like 1 n=1 Tax=Ornithodoros turicata TaxID=34597 RepID=UPI00313A26DB
MVAEKQRKPGAVGSARSLSVSDDVNAFDDSLPWSHVLGFKTAAIILSVAALVIMGTVLFFSNFDISQKTTTHTTAITSVILNASTTGIVLTRKPLYKSAIYERKYETVHGDKGAEVTSTENLHKDAVQNAPSVNSFENWREVDPDDVGTTDRKDCKRPMCKWISRYISSKLDWTIKPCHDFYSHVCSSKWFASDNVEEMDFPSQSLARFMKHLKHYIIHKATGNAWEKNAASLFKGCLQGDRTLTHIRPRFPIWPLKRLSGIQTLAKLQAYCLRFYKSQPLLETFIAPSGTRWKGGERSNFALFADSPTLPVSRFQLLYPSAAEDDYKRLIRSLIEDKDGDRIAQGIIKLEKALVKVISKEYVSLSHRAVNVLDLIQDDDDWQVLLKTALSNQKDIRTLDRNYLFKLRHVLKNASSTLDVANYMVYYTLVQLSPLIRNLTFLIPLGMGKTIRGVSVSTQGCLRLTEKAYEHGMRILGMMALGAQDWTHEKPKEVAVRGIVSDLKRILAKHAEEWFTTPGTRKEAIKKLKALKVVILGAAPLDAITYARGEKVVGSKDVVSLLQGGPARDSVRFGFFPGSVFDTTPRYLPEVNTVYLPHAMFGTFNNVSNPADPLFLPLIGASMLEAMMSAMDSRGAERIIGPSGISANWWDIEEETKANRKKECFKNLYGHRLKELLISSSRQVFMEKFLARGALLEPLYQAYHNRVTQHYPDGLHIDPGLSADMLFYVIYAMGLCEQPGSEKYKIKHKAGIPARILVNAHVGSSERFRRAFHCKTDDDMVPVKPCSYWKP